MNLMLDDQKARERFYAKISMPDDPDGCWIWTAGKSGKGYGHFSLYGKKVLAHRVVYANNVGPIPDGLCVLHKCDTPACVNLTHLFLGTKADNNADMIGKGRFRPPVPQVGSENGQSKLIEIDIPVIREWSNLGYTNQSISEPFGVSAELIGRIVRRNCWRHVA